MRRLKLYSKIVKVVPYPVGEVAVLSVAPVMIAQWENECISLPVLPVARVHFQTVTEYFMGFLPG